MAWKWNKDGELENPDNMRSIFCSLDSCLHSKDATNVRIKERDEVEFSSFSSSLSTFPKESIVSTSKHSLPAVGKRHLQWDVKIDKVLLLLSQEYEVRWEEIAEEAVTGAITKGSAG